ncbi:MAG: FkbM family methyltransferase, partial [Ilumatobacteraceae bacterium]
MHAVTIVARNYLPMAKVLAASFLSNHPHGRFSALLIDGDERDRAAADGLDILLVEDLGLPREQWRAMAAMYSVTEYATALKPATLRHLLGTTPRGRAVAYLDPDILVFAPLDDVFAAAVADDIVLTPHVTQPMPRDGRTPDEEVIRHAGIFNLGFLCVGHEALPFLDWWHERLVTDAVVDLPRALFTDQRWMDWVPALFRHRVLRDTGLNAAYWNLHERPLAHDYGSLTAGGAPLRFFHFSGFDPRNPTLLSRHGGTQPRVLISEHPLLRELCEQYATLLAAQGFGTRTEGYGREHSVAGHRLTTHVRTAYRRSLLDAQRGLEPMPPDPFEPSEVAAFDRWLAEEVAGPAGSGFTRWELAIYEERVDLQVVFPDHLGTNAAALRRWLDTDAYPLSLRAEVAAGTRLADHPTAHRRRAVPAADREPVGINVVGYHAAELGVGEAARRMTLAIDHVGLPHHHVGVPAAGARHQQALSYTPDRQLQFRDSLYCVNADETVRVTNSLEHPARQRSDAHRFGLWFWELAEFPTKWHAAFELL